MTDFLSSLKIAATGLHAQNARMRVIAENLANADSAGKTPTDKPYQRRIPTFKAVMDDAAGGEIVKVGKIALDQSAFQERYDVQVLHAWGMTELCPLGTVASLPSRLCNASTAEQDDYAAKQGTPVALMERPVKLRAATFVYVPMLRSVGLMP